MSKTIKISKRMLRYINYSALARDLNVSPQYVSMILADKRKAPSMREKIMQLIKKELRAA